MRTIDRLSEFWLILYVIILIGAAVGATLFPILYSSMVRWWETSMGKYMMYQGIVLALSLDLVAARIFVRALPLWVSFVLLGLIMVMIWANLILFIHTYIKGRSGRRQDRTQRRSDKRLKRGN